MQLEEENVDVEKLPLPMKSTWLATLAAKRE